jgi:hypothetical protein
VARLVERAGSLQAQHPDWPPLALQSRMAARSQPVDLVRARAGKSIVRASLMRMTVHVVSAADFWPMSMLTHPFRLEQWRLLFKADPVSSPLGKRITRGHAAVLAAMADRPLAIHEIEAILKAEMGRTEIPPNRPLWRHFSGTVPLVHVPYPEETYGRTRYVRLSTGSRHRGRPRLIPTSRLPTSPGATSRRSDRRASRTSWPTSVGAGTSPGGER